MMRSSKRFKGECAAIDATMVADKERSHLDTIGVPHYDYPALALQCAHAARMMPSHAWLHGPLRRMHGFTAMRRMHARPP